MKFQKAISLGLVFVASFQSMGVDARGLNISGFLNEKVESVTHKVSNATYRISDRLSTMPDRVGSKVSNLKYAVSDSSIAQGFQSKTDRLFHRSSNSYSTSKCSASYPSHKAPTYAQPTYQAKTPVNYSAPVTNYSQGNQINSAIKKASYQTGLPENLIKALIKKESSFNPQAVSRSGARGLTQLMPSTAKGECGLYESELFNVDKNVNCGINYLKKQVDYFGRYDLALAAYNAGPGAVRRAIQQVGSRDINKVTSVLKAETKPYVQKILIYKSEFDRQA